MKRKLIVGAVCAGLLGLAVYVLISGGKKLHNPRSGGEAMTVVVELPKTNTSTATGVRYERDKPR
jgi:hypothetical protein